MECQEMDWKEGKLPGNRSSSPKKVIDSNLPEPCKNTDLGADNNIPAGLEALFNVCKNIYPEQPNPLQVTALVKYWLGGPDPLDYISMYDVPGNDKLKIPPHWHYISFGLSDIHGDGRVHEFTGPNKVSGFGFELTMRLKKEPTDKGPPTWPAAIMQGLAKYVFQSESVLCVGDHVSWHSPLDGGESRLQHMLMAEDPRLGAVRTPNGSVQFVQVVGITSEELRAVQHWNGAGLIDILKRSAVTGGPWLVTDMRRGESIYELDPSVAEEVEAGIESQGSNLSGVSAKISWVTHPEIQLSASQEARMGEGRPCGASDAVPAGGADASKQSSPGDGHQKQETARQNDTEDKTSSGAVPAELFETQRVESLHITINLESGALLPLALRGRLKHGRHFTFKAVLGPNALTLIAPGVSGAFVSSESPYACRGPWLQVLIPEDLIEVMSVDLAGLADPDEVKVPVSFQWPAHKLTLTIVGEDA